MAKILAFTSLLQQQITMKSKPPTTKDKKIVVTASKITRVIVLVQHFRKPTLSRWIFDVV